MDFPKKITVTVSTPTPENQIKYLLEELRVFHRNLGKDSKERRSDISIINRNLGKLERLGVDLRNYRKEINEGNYQLDAKVLTEVKANVDLINKYFSAIEKILKDRLASCEVLEESVGTMSEKFDLKTASGLIPSMNGTEVVTKQLIDAIELYDSLLDDNGKRLLTKFVLKTKLDESAKIRLNQDYATNQLLINDLRKHFLTVKSAAALSVKLNNARQGSKPIEEFGKSIEELLVDLTITQAEGNQDKVNILRGVNEKIAINSFANGLQNSQLRTIIKARNYSNLSNAIRGAKDEEITFTDKSDRSSQNFFYIRGRGFSRGARFFRGNTRLNNNNNFRNNNQNHRGFNLDGHGPSRGKFQNFRGNFSRPRTFRNNHTFRHNNFGHRNYFLQNSENQSISNSVNAEQSQSNLQFFRAPTQQ